MNKVKKEACPKGVECPVCFGLGFFEDGFTEVGIPVTKPCRYALAQEILGRLDQAWEGLSQAKKIDSSPLSGRDLEDLYITGSIPTFRSHLKYVAIRLGRTRGVQVVSDLDLVTAWLGSISRNGGEILDPDAAAVSSKKLTLVDLIEPPDLLVVRLGVKSSRNVAMSEVFEETLRHRAHLNKATWVYDPDWTDSQGEKWKIASGHRCYADSVAEYMGPWPHIILDGGGPRLQVQVIGGDGEGQVVEGASALTSYAPMAMTLSGAHTQADNATHRVVRETREPKKKPFKRFNGDS